MRSIAAFRPYLMLFLNQGRRAPGFFIVAPSALCGLLGSASALRGPSCDALHLVLQLRDEIREVKELFLVLDLALRVELKMADTFEEEGLASLSRKT